MIITENWIFSLYRQKVLIFAVFIIIFFCRMQSVIELSSLKTLQRALQSHPIYSSVKSERNMKIFMESHVFAVWDFMLLLKELQRRLTCVEKFWTPSVSPNTARFINEIVLGQETDIHPNGKDYISHFELYLNAMEEVGANTGPVLTFVNNVASGKQIQRQIRNRSIPQGVAQFVLNTLNVLDKPTPYVASEFFYGRENAIPQMFQRFLGNMQKIQKYKMLRYYFQIHIQADSESHGPMAQKLIKELAQKQDKKYQMITSAAVNAIQNRIKLWDNIYKTLQI